MKQWEGYPQWNHGIRFCHILAQGYTVEGEERDKMKTMTRVQVRVKICQWRWKNKMSLRTLEIELAGFALFFLEYFFPIFSPPFPLTS